ncbi:MAG TPA: SDR family NAD(P)-dependent oxidoreductase [Bosea sp. (in: a-proteobacteria)]|uniref:SDR family NAD(P)-dependent oxidoreductase n=1 Tax=Bosea sp. (in: a-proteobacteria) TaxID=1871050 RepID=UPI002E15EF45|nr:SDR family NAD(P)-dependent oxidoreductase [Bosea sp. (in: a-proteobacteria)]
MTIHPALAPGHVAVVTGAASGIGLAAARAFAALGMKVVLADRDEALLAAAVAELADAGATVLARAVDVGNRASLEALKDEVIGHFRAVHVLMNNAGIQPGSAVFGPVENWERVFAVNLWGAIHGCQIFAPAMLEGGQPGLIVNTGSKQGITTPPGDPAYNVSKAGLKVFTEALQHELRGREGARLSAHLLIPGFVFTGLTARGRPEKPSGAWTPEQTVAFMLERLAAGDFYILCPDGETTRDLDEKRMAWAMGDIIENRPPLSRWHRDYGDAFKAFLEEETRPAQ